jgi:formylglycine-generating enzyme required for sulfatase activity
MTQWGALQYARWLTEKTGVFFRLPTEAEWEFACLSGDINTSPFGIARSQMDEHAWFSENSGNRIKPVAGKHPNPAGLFDMNGNVEEWTLDQYDDSFYDSLAEEQSPVVDPWRIPEKLHPRTVRGGYYSSDLDELRCSRRVQSNLRWKRRDPQIPKSFWWNTDSPFVGFRLVAPLQPPSKEEQKEFWSLVLGE